MYGQILHRRSDKWRIKTTTNSSELNKRTRKYTYLLKVVATAKQSASVYSCFLVSYYHLFPNLHSFLHTILYWTQMLANASNQQMNTCNQLILYWRYMYVWSIWIARYRQRCSIYTRMFYEIGGFWSCSNITTFALIS